MASATFFRDSISSRDPRFPVTQMLRTSHPVVKDWRTLLRELTITFVGVLLAILASAWWTERVDRKHEHAYISQLRADLTTTKSNLDSIIAENTKGIKA